MNIIIIKNAPNQEFVFYFIYKLTQQIEKVFICSANTSPSQ